MPKTETITLTDPMNDRVEALVKRLRTTHGHEMATRDSVLRSAIDHGLDAIEQALDGQSGTAGPPPEAPPN